MSVSVIPESENEGELRADNTEAEAPAETSADAVAEVSVAPAQEVVAEAVAETNVQDERANVPVSETTERFLRAILLKVPLDRIEELHLFSPLRQGTIETGIAVVAARVIIPEEPESDTLELELEAGNEVYVDEALSDADVDASVDATVDAAVDASVDASVEVSVDAEIEATEDATVDASVDVESDLDGAVDAESDVDVSESMSDVSESDEDADEITEGALEHAAEFIAEDDDDSPYADEPRKPLRVTADNSKIVAAQGVEAAVAAPVAIATPIVKAPRIRHTVYTARYRLVVKGPERGRWEIDVVDEADAPLLTVETVVRGVQRRSGEETATVRYDGPQIAKALRLPIPQSL